MQRKGRARQTEFGFANWGGRREGAGRKPKGERAGVPHERRAALAARFPVHVTLKVVHGVPSLRRKETVAALRRAFGATRFGTRVVHDSVQTNHVHLLVGHETPCPCHAG
jgi:hypothetical protein